MSLKTKSCPQTFSCSTLTKVRLREMSSHLGVTISSWIHDAVIDALRKAEEDKLEDDIISEMKISISSKTANTLKLLSEKEGMTISQYIESSAVQGLKNTEVF